MSAEEQRTLGWEGETRAAQQDKNEGHRQGCEIWEAGTENSVEKGSIVAITTRRVTLKGEMYKEDFQKVDM